ncbi:MAG: hypothetical protein A3F16_04670 [Deltaproteobacteria bacterium RIFCSPHIGHO2_12_FULL_43_9]|nr:MAG: hypothetical protein A3F16_04670 [Deltaproteobacteria bacterium RIFCSPHIGHO2_12_FULL_43_9]
MKFLFFMILSALTVYSTEVTVTKGIFITPDKEQVKINYELYLPEQKGKNAVILLHMLGQQRGEWKELARALASKGFGVMALDFRGHGESIFKKNEKPLFYREFANSDFALLKEDVRGAVQEMVRQGFESIALVGASIGANIAVSFVAEEASVKALVLLSPGADYRGIRLDSYAKELKVSILLISSEEDLYSFRSSEKFMKELNPERSKVTWLPVKGSGHGTRMLKNERVVKAIEEFLSGELS